MTNTLHSIIPPRGQIPLFTFLKKEYRSVNSMAKSIRQPIFQFRHRTIGRQEYGRIKLTPFSKEKRGFFIYYKNINPDISVNNLEGG